MKTKKERNKPAEVHVLTLRESQRLRSTFSKFMAEVERIRKSGSLPEGNWLPSNDFMFLRKGD